MLNNGDYSTQNILRHYCFMHHGLGVFQLCLIFFSYSLNDSFSLWSFSMLIYTVWTIIIINYKSDNNNYRDIILYLIIKHYYYHRAVERKSRTWIWFFEQIVSIINYTDVKISCKSKKNIEIHYKRRLLILFETCYFRYYPRFYSLPRVQVVANILSSPRSQFPWIFFKEQK